MTIQAVFQYLQMLHQSPVSSVADSSASPADVHKVRPDIKKSSGQENNATQPKIVQCIFTV